ncbi:MAG: amidase [Tepidiformaceae bacterium]
MTDLPLTISEAAAAMRAGTLSSVDITKTMIERADHLDPLLGTYIGRDDVAALAAARKADEELAAGIDRGPLHGIPIGVKDIIATKDAPTTAQSLVLDPNWGANVDAPVVARLRAAGAVITGKTSTMEFACGYPDATKPFPVPKNPWNTDHWTGGSSSGTGNGVAAGLFYGGLGTDTGGSIRIPSAYCGISGMKQTFGRVPKSGCAPVGYSMDHIGPMARSVRDCAIMLQVLAGHDPSDLCSEDVPVPGYLAALTGSLKGVRIGVEREHHLSHPNQDPAIVAVFEAAVAVLATAGAELVDVSLPHFTEIVDSANTTMRPEAFAYHRADMQVRRDLYGVYTTHFLFGGSMPTGYEYVQAQRLRQYAKRAVAELMAPLDVIVSPTTGGGALKLVDVQTEAMFTSPNYTRYWNVLGFPAMAIPMGFNNAGMPLSLQVIARPFDESASFMVGDAYQQLTDWHLKVPAIAARAPAMAG